MSIIVEDGTGLTTATSYVSVADADAYHLARLHASWAAKSLADKEAALIRATAALDLLTRWKGFKYSSAQALAWPRCRDQASAWPGTSHEGPRSSVIDDDGYAIDGVPKNVVSATCEAALLEIVEPGVLTPSVEGRIIREGGTSYEYNAGASGVPTYTVIEGLLKGLTARRKLKRG